MSEHCLRCFHKLDRTEAGCQHSNGWTLNTLKHSYFPMQISVSNLQICWLTAVNICLHLCCTPSALHCRMFVSVLISFPLSWPFQIKCNSSAEIQICIITRQPLTESSWHHCHQAPVRTWLTHGPFLLCDDNVTWLSEGAATFPAIPAKFSHCRGWLWILADLRADTDNPPPSANKEAWTPDYHWCKVADLVSHWWLASQSWWYPSYLYSVPWHHFLVIPP